MALVLFGRTRVAGIAVRVTIGIGLSRVVYRRAIVDSIVNRVTVEIIGDVVAAAVDLSRACWAARNGFSRGLPVSLDVGISKWLVVEPRDTDSSTAWPRALP